MCEQVNNNNVSVFVCNHKPADHACDEASSVLILQDGTRVADTAENNDKYRVDIRGGSVCCSVCGKALIDDAWFL